MREPDRSITIPTEVARRARDAAYTAVGMGVLGIQRARALRRALGPTRRLDEGAARLRTEVATGTRQVGEWLGDTLALLSSQLAPLGDQLPEPARELAEKGRRGLEAIGSELRQLLAPGS